MTARLIPSTLVARGLGVSPRWVNALAARLELGRTLDGCGNTVWYTNEEVAAIRASRRPPGNPNFIKKNNSEKK